MPPAENPNHTKGSAGGLRRVADRREVAAFRAGTRSGVGCEAGWGAE
ncbi:hypothetical protein [Microlunatus endophyticus]|nr:hypothetical protein [Microlunatus endophyticus]